MSTQTKFSKRQILGVEFDNVSPSEVLEYIAQLLNSKTKRAHYIVKPYVEHLEKAARDQSIKQLLNQAHLALPDGVSLNWACYFYYHTAGHWWDVISSGLKIIFRPLELHLSLPNYSWGTNFTWSLLQTAAQSNWRVFLVGSPKQSDIKATQQYLEQAIPGIKIVGTCPGRDPQTGHFSRPLEKALLLQLQAQPADLILIGIGFPAQEQLSARLAAQLSHGLLIGEGGTFDYRNFGGRLAKAPTFIQKHGLEWLWRLAREPSRLRRQLTIPRFIWKVYRSHPRSIRIDD